jgi:hypothetical protein
MQFLAICLGLWWPLKKIAILFQKVVYISKFCVFVRYDNFFLLIYCVESFHNFSSSETLIDWFFGV